MTSYPYRWWYGCGVFGEYRRRLWDVALEQYGYVTTSDAARVGVPAVEVRKLASRGGLSRVAQGVYRFDDVAPSERDGFCEAVLSAGPGAMLAGESVLALHGLGQVNPAVYEVVTPHRVRRARRADVEIRRRQVPDADRTVYYGIASMTVRRALLDAVATVMTSRLHVAARDARTEGLISAEELTEIEAILNPTGQGLA